MRLDPKTTETCASAILPAVMKVRAVLGPVILEKK